MKDKCSEDHRLCFWLDPLETIDDKRTWDVGVTCHDCDHIGKESKCIIHISWREYLVKLKKRGKGNEQT